MPFASPKYLCASEFRAAWRFALPKRLDWDAVARLQRSQRHGSEYAYDELPPAGSRADQARCLTASANANDQSESSPPRPGPKRKKKRKWTRGDKIRRLYLALERQVLTAGTPAWAYSNSDYQQRFLTELQSTLSSLLELDPTKRLRPPVLKAHRILFKYRSLARSQGFPTQVGGETGKHGKV